MNIFKHFKNIVSGTDNGGDSNMARITRSTGAGPAPKDTPAKKPAAKKKAASKKAKKVEAVEKVEEVKAASPVDTSKLRVVTRAGSRSGEVVKLVGMLNGGKAVCEDKNGARFKIHVNNLGPVEDK